MLYLNVASYFPSQPPHAFSPPSCFTCTSRHLMRSVRSQRTEIPDVLQSDSQGSLVRELPKIKDFFIQATKI